MSLIKLLESVLLSEKRYQSKKAPHFKIKPSVLGSPCMRKIFYSSGMVQEDFEDDLKSKKRMALGDSIHDTLKKIYRKSGQFIEYVNPDGSIPKGIDGQPDQEFPLKCDELFIEYAKIDGVFIIDGKLWLGEFKSMKHDYFVALHTVKPEHFIQGVIYYYVFNKLLAEGKFKHIKALDGFTKAEGVIYLYVNKDNQELQEFAFTEADEVFKKIVEKILLAKMNYDKQILPPKTPDFCGTCPWREKCKKNQLK